MTRTAPRSRTTMGARGRLAGTGLAAVLMVGPAMGVALPAAADETRTPSNAPSSSAAPNAPTAPSGLTGPGKRRLERRADRLCRRVPEVDARLTRVIARVSGGADTRGSVQWLRARADRVRAKNPTFADLLDSRAEIRQARLPVLRLRKQELPKVTAWCKAHGRPAGG